MFRELLVPTDLSEGSLGALRLAIKIARESKGRITLLHVGVTPMPIGLESYGAVSAEVLEGLREQMARENRHACEKIIADELPTGMEYRIALREGYPPEEIAAEAKASTADVVVMGTHGRTGLQRVLLGSVAERVIRTSEVPVLVTR